MTNKEITITENDLLKGLLAVVEYTNSELYSDEFVVETASEPEEVKNNHDNLINIFKGGIINAN